MNDTDYEVPSLEATDDIRYVPIPGARYAFELQELRYTDPKVMGWEEPEDLSDEDRADWRRPFLEVAVRITGDEAGGESPYAGRFVRGRLSLREGENKKTGRPYKEAFANLIRLKNGLGAEDSIRGCKLVDVSRDGLDPKEYVEKVNEALKDYVGLKGIVRTYVTKAEREGIGAILVPKA